MSISLWVAALDFADFPLRHPVLCEVAGAFVCWTVGGQIVEMASLTEHKSANGTRRTQAKHLFAATAGEAGGSKGDEQSLSPSPAFFKNLPQFGLSMNHSAAFDTSSAIKVTAFDRWLCSVLGTTVSPSISSSLRNRLGGNSIGFFDGLNHDLNHFDSLNHGLGRDLGCQNGLGHDLGRQKIQLNCHPGWQFNRFFRLPKRPPK